MALSATDRRARIAELRSQIDALRAELEKLEQEEEDAPYRDYVERARAAGQRMLARDQFLKYVTAHDQLERQWVQLGRPTDGWQYLSTFRQLRSLLQLPPVAATEVPVPSARGAPAVATARAATPTPAATQARPAAPGGAAAVAPAPQRKVPVEQLVEMHQPILNEVVELTKRATEEFRSAKVADGIISTERAMYLMERVAHAPPAMPTRLGQMIDEALKASGIQEADRQKLGAIRERAAKLATESAQFQHA